MNSIFIAGNFFYTTSGTVSIGEELTARLRGRGVEVFTASSKRNRFFRMVDFLWTSLYHRKTYIVALVEVYSGLAFWWAYFLSVFLQLLKKPFILTLHGGKLPEFIQKHQLTFRKFLNSASFVITPSRYLLESFNSICPNIIYIPNGIEINNYELNTRYNAKPNLIWLRAFHSIYSPITAIEVLHLLSKDYPAAALTMLGPDKEDGSFREVNRKICDYKLEDKVVFTGPIPKEKVGEYLSHGDVFLNTTLYESFGVSVLEAAACGLCIVTTNVGELPYLWENDVDALFVPPTDPEAMASAVKRILEEPGLAEKLSTNARKKAEQYDWSVILPQWERIIDSVS